MNRTNIDMLGRSPVLSLEEALTVLRHAVPCGVLPVESVCLEDALGRVLAGDHVTTENLPAHPRSVMDGFALRAADTYGASDSTPAYLAVAGEVRMGDLPGSGPAVGACFRIATGGLVPPGCDAVIPLEHTVAVDAAMIEVVRQLAPGTHVIQAGDDVRHGEIIFTAGHRLRPQDLGLLAGLGVAEIAVHRQPRVAILSTGDEIVDFRATPAPGRVRDMNAVQLAALVRQEGGAAIHFGIVRDEKEEFLEVMEKALATCDGVLFSGSSSVGSRDLGERIVAKIAPGGLLLHGVAIRPGKPVLAALVGERVIFGLPGHPVSAAVAFSLFVRPVLRHLAGELTAFVYRPRMVRARLMRNVNSAAGRTDFVPVRIEENSDGAMSAHPVLGKSGALSILVRADGLVTLPTACQGIRQYQEVEVALFD